MMRLAGLVAALVLACAGPAAADVVRASYNARQYRLYEPDAPARGRPLVVALHGCAQTPDDFATATRLDRAAGRRGLRVVYPAQARANNVARCWNWFASSAVRGPGEVDELLELIRHVQQSRGVESPEIVVIGFSAGAYMAVNLACAAPDVIVGVGAVAGGPYGCAATSGGPIQCMRGERLDGEAAASRCGATSEKLRASLWHGDGDSVVSPANLTALTTMFLRVRGLMPPAAGRGATSREPVGTPEQVDGARRTVYRTADGRSVIETWVVPGMGHAWSGGDSRGSHTYPAGPDATEAMLRFLVDP
jgi:poly(hydroxyalkanoate) depolymerase family esterase